MELIRLLKGLITFMPGSTRLLMKRGTGGTDTGSYCYEVWLKHITLLHQNGLTGLPKTVAELGPGDSLGMGLSAMLSGADKYYALDIVNYSNTDLNLKIFDTLVEMFTARKGRPRKGWPDYDMYLDENLFPSHILTEEVLKRSLAEDRVSLIRKALENPGNEFDGIEIKYMVPWTDEKVINPGTVDLVLSHSVLEHVMDLEGTYHALRSWLKPGGMMSHQIDFTSHGYSDQWNGFRAYSDLLWKCIEGNRPYRLNLQPFSTHLTMLERHGFDVFCALHNTKPGGISRAQLSKRWEDISDEDLTTSGAFIQARKRE